MTALPCPVVGRGPCNELKGQTLVVIVAVLLIAAFIGLVDVVLNNTVRLLITTIS
jgi:preprotein translocase SecE subunit